MENNFFTDCTSNKDVQSEYKRLVKLHHPDLGGDCETMKLINQALDFIKSKSLQGYLSSQKIELSSGDIESDISLNDLNDKDFVEIVKFCQHNLIEVELVGSWLWLKADFLKSREDLRNGLKALGCKFSASKKSWFFVEKDFKKKRRGFMSLDKIKDKYGAKAFKSTKQLQEV
ncbi:MAG TPA: hypothetical protein V6C96_01815 [Vampirovibrionales bacterium]